MADDRYAVCNKLVKRLRPSQEARAEVEAYISVGDHIVFINDLSGRAALGDERRKTLMSQSRMIEERAGETAAPSGSDRRVLQREKHIY